MVKLSEGCIDQCNLSPEWDNKVGIITDEVCNLHSDYSTRLFRVMWSEGYIDLEDGIDLEVVSETR